MKKKTLIFSILMSMTATGVLASCNGENNNSSNPSNSAETSASNSVETSANTSTNSGSEQNSSVTDQSEELVNAALNLLSVDETVTDSFELTVSAPGGVRIAWQSSNNDVISIDGQLATVTRPEADEEDVTVTLTATASKGTVSNDRTFDVTVLKKEAFDDDKYDLTSIAEVKEGEIGTAYTVKGVVSAFVGGEFNDAYSANGFYLSDETGTIYVYAYSIANTVEIGNEIVLTASLGEYSGGKQLIFASGVTKLEEVVRQEAEVPDPSNYVIEGKTVADVLDTPEDITIGEVYKLEGWLTKFEGTGSDGAYTNYRFANNADGSKYINIYSSASGFGCPENAWLDEYVGAKLSVAYYMNSRASSGTGNWRGNIIYVFDVLEEAPIKPTETNTIAEVKEGEIGTLYNVEGVVSAFVGGKNSSGESSPNGFYLTDETDTIYVYGYKLANQVERGDKVKFTAKLATYSGGLQLSDGTDLTKLDSNQDIPAPVDANLIKDMTIADVETSSSVSAGEIYKLEGYVVKKVTTVTKYCFASTADGSTSYINIYSSAGDIGCPENAWLDQYIGTQITVAFYMNSKSGDYWRGNIIYVFEA